MAANSKFSESQFSKKSQESPAVLIRELLQQQINELKMEALKRDKVDALRRAKHSAGFEQVATGRMGALQRAMQVAGLNNTSRITELLFANNPNSDVTVMPEHEKSFRHPKGLQNPPATSAAPLDIHQQGVALWEA